MSQFPVSAVSDDPNALIPSEEPGFDGEDAPDSETAVLRVCAELGDEASESKVSVHRVVKGQREGIFCNEYAPSEFSLQRIAEDSGGGTYRVRVYVPRYIMRGATRIKSGVMVAKNQIVTIDGEPKNTARREPADAESGSAANVAINPGNIVREVLAQLPKPLTLREQLEDLRMVQDLFAPKLAAEKPRDTLADFLRSLEIQDKLQAALPRKSSGGDDGLVALLGVAKEFMNAIRTQGGVPAVAAQPSLAAPVDAPDAPASEEPARAPAAGGQLSEEEQAMHLLYVGYISMLVAKARRAEDVSEIAEDVYDKLPEEALKWLLDDPDYIRTLSTYHKDVPIFRVWFDKLRTEIVRLHAEENGSGKTS